MQRVTKIVVAVASVCALAALGDWMIFEWNIVRPVEKEVRDVLAQSDPEDRYPPAAVRRAILAGFGNNESLIRMQVARILEFRMSSGTRRNVDRELHETLVAYACKRFTSDQLIGLYAVMSYNGNDHGMNHLSMRLFGKPLQGLSDDEAAKVVAYYWGPAYMAGHPDAWNARASHIRIAMDGSPNR